MHYALTSFDVQGELIKAQPIYGCDFEGDPAQYKDKVIIVEYDSDYCFAQVSLLSAQALNAKVSTVISRKYDSPHLLNFLPSRQLYSPATTLSMS